MVEATETQTERRKLVLKPSQGFFMKHSRLPSILCFSSILCFYGGKLEIRRLVLCLAKGGLEFFTNKVKNGHFFKISVCDSNLLYLNQALVSKFLKAEILSKPKKSEEEKKDEPIIVE